MKIFTLQLLCDGNQLSSAFDLSSIGYFQRIHAKEMINFFANLLDEHTQRGQRQTIQYEDYFCHIDSRSDGLSVVAITDHEYPQRVIFGLLIKVQSTSNLYTMMNEYQDVSKVDRITYIQNQLGELRLELEITINNIMIRGSKLDELVEKSKKLSTHSKIFYKQSRRLNSCCNIS